MMNFRLEPNQTLKKQPHQVSEKRTNFLRNLSTEVDTRKNSRQFHELKLLVSLCAFYSIHNCGIFSFVVDITVEVAFHYENSVVCFKIFKLEGSGTIGGD